MDKKNFTFCLILTLGLCVYSTTPPSFGQSHQHLPMNEITVPRIPVSEDTSITSIKNHLKKHSPLHTIEQVNWSDYPYRPSVNFRIGHTGTEIWLTFYVVEKHVLARKTETNSATHLDSCVEFFIDPRQDGNYYNFEFNAIGTTHLAYGQNVRERRFIDPERIQSQIRTHSSLGTDPIDQQNGEFSWDLTVVIPVSILTHDEVNEWSGKTMRANFFKCGDETDTPHFLSWNPVGTKRPSFHQPEYFGRLVFE